MLNTSLLSQLMNLIVALSLTISPMVNAMSISDIGKAVVFSEVSAVVTYEGKPVQGATVTRTAKWQRVKSDQTMTNEQGYFSFPSMAERSIAQVLPMQFVSTQTISVNYKGEDFEIWYGSKLNPKEFAESRGKPIQLTCELTHERRGVAVDGQVFLTTCEWDVVPDEPINFDDAFSKE